MTTTTKRLSLLLALALPAPAAAQAQLAQEDNPAIIALRESDPRSPEQLMFAIKITMGFDRVDELQRYAKQLLAANVDDAGKVALHRRYGSRLFLQLNDPRKYGDEFADFCKSVMNAVEQYSKAEDRLRALAQTAQSDNEVARRAAVVELLKGGKAAAPILLNAMSQASSDLQRARLRTALMAMEGDAIQPLIAALQSDNAAIATQCCEALGLMKTRKAVPYLVRLSMDAKHPSMSAARSALLQIVGVAPSPAEALTFLRRKIEAFSKGDLPSRADINGQIEVFNWDNELNTVVSNKLAVEKARYSSAAQLSRDLAAISNVPEDQLNALVVQLQDAQLQAGADQQLPEDSSTWKMAVQLKPSLLEAALKNAIERGWSPAATAALQALGTNGNAALLDSKTGHPRPVAKALTHEDRRIRYAALRAIMNLDPQGPFAGSTDVVDSIEYFIRSSGTRKVIVAHPNLSVAQTIVGLVRTQDYEGHAATSGRQVIQFAQANPDAEMILISSMLTRPSAGETMVLLRQDPRTAQLPIGIFARDDDFKAAERLAETDRRSLALPRLHSSSGAAVHIGRLLRISSDMSPQSSRIIQAGAALRMLTKLATDRERYDFYEVFRLEAALVEAAQQEVLAEQAAKVLGLLGTSRAQQTLLRMALETALPESARDACLDALVNAVKLRGLQLTNALIREQQFALRNSPVSDQATNRIRQAVLNLFVGKPIAEKPPAKPAKENAPS